MYTYTATIKSLFGGVTTVAVMANSYNDAIVIAQSQYGDKLVYVQS